jgi:tRNA U34 5-carboxymethylaminomethyl modifying GTPase MnmE/TrmE
MFKWFRKPPDLEKEVLDEQIYMLAQIRELWACNQKLSEALHQVSDCMKQIAESGMVTRQDLDFLAENVVRLAEQQNRLTSHVMRNDNLLDDIQSTRVH